MLTSKFSISEGLIFGRNALSEQLITGGFAGFDRRLDEGVWDRQISGVILHEPAIKFRSSAACVDFQLEVLRRFFSRIREMAGNRGISMGLSGGFDSRLMLLLAIDAGIPVHPFTFSSPNHDQEEKIAQAISEAAGVELRRIPLRKWTELGQTELEQNIDDSISFYEGRTNRTMGSFNDVHTARVHRECVGGASLNLNGLGGEMYRNRERLPPYRFKFENWLWQYVAGPEMMDAFYSDEDRREFENRMACKYGGLLGVGRLKWVDRHVARCWYRKVWLPYFAGVRLAAENRVGPSLMPFAEPEISRVALAATPFIGAHGEFEAEMIRKVDARISAIPSSYGYGFSSIPRHQKFRDLVASLVPIQARLARNRLKGKLCKDCSAGLPAKFRERFSAQIENLKEMGLPVDIEYLLTKSDSRDRTLYVAEYLYRNRKEVDTSDAVRTNDPT